MRAARERPHEALVRGDERQFFLGRERHVDGVVGGDAVLEGKEKRCDLGPWSLEALDGKIQEVDQIVEGSSRSQPSSAHGLDHAACALHIEEPRGDEAARTGSERVHDVLGTGTPWLTEYKTQGYARIENTTLVSGARSHLYPRV